MVRYWLDSSIQVHVDLFVSFLGRQGVEHQVVCLGHHWVMDGTQLLSLDWVGGESVDVVPVLALV